LTEVRTCLYWLSVFQPLQQAFLDAVKQDPEAFAILLVACSSIIDSLCDDHTDFPQVLALLLAPVHWAINLNNDYIHATCHDNVVMNYNLYLSRASQSMQHPGANDYPFGKSSAAMNPALPVLHPLAQRTGVKASFVFKHIWRPIVLCLWLAIFG
jgi:hypothetical protein